MEEFSDIINWDRFLDKSQDFKTKKPFKFTFIEEIFNRDFYEKLYNSYPSLDLDTWHESNTPSKYQLNQFWGGDDSFEVVEPGEDSRFSSEWNLFKKIC